MRGLPSILSLFRNKFNKFNNTGACILKPTADWSPYIFTLVQEVLLAWTKRKGTLISKSHTFSTI